MNFENLIKELNFPDEIENVIKRNYYDKKDKIVKISEIAYKSNNLDFPLLNYSPEIYLTVVTNLLVNKYWDYREKNVSDEIIINTFKDVVLRSTLFLQQTGTVGLSKEDVIWFRHIMAINIFKIGSLQYQPFKMIYLDEVTIGEPYMIFTEKQYEILPVNTPVINCHIQKGANLKSEKVDESLDKAKKFFRVIFPDINYKYFLCYSWLLYPSMVNSLSESSNIRSFASKFTVIGSCDDSEQSFKEIDFNRESELSKIDKEKLGFACGTIEIKNF